MTSFGSVPGEDDEDDPFHVWLNPQYVRYFDGSNPENGEATNSGEIFELVSPTCKMLDKGIEQCN